MQTNKINVMHIRDSSGLFGGERVILNLGKHIDKERFHFTLLCMDNQDPKDKPLMDIAASAGIPVTTVRVRGRLDLRTIKSMRRIFKADKINIIHSHDFKSNFYGLLASLKLGIKRVTTAHGSTRDSMLKRIYLFFDERFVYKFYDVIVAVSKELGSQLKKLTSRKEKIIVIQNGIDSEELVDTRKEGALEPIEIPDNHKVFGIIGRLFPDKGHAYLLEAFSHVCNRFPLTKVLIVGDGPARDAIAKQIDLLHLNNHVCLCGVRSDISYVYHCIDCIVIPSFREGLPYVLLEALLRKIPVIASAVGDIPLIITDGVTGTLIPPGDLQALENRMIDFLSNPDQHKSMAEKGCALVKEKFSADKMARDTEILYQSLIA
jgi:glycosyltransferase involved in cell wall biosynthesis